MKESFSIKCKVKQKTRMNDKKLLFMENNEFFYDRYTFEDGFELISNDALICLLWAGVSTVFYFMC